MVLVRSARRSDARDLLLLAKLLAAAVQDPAPHISERSLAAALFGRSRWAECFVAVEGSAIVGYATASRYFEAHTGRRELRIADLYVTERARLSGTGRALFERLLKRARALNCDSVSWEVWRANAAAYAFYEALGAIHANDVSTMRLEL